MSGPPVSLYAELKRRRVFRAMIGYGIVVFALLQVVEPIMHGLHLPEVTITFVVVALGLGFPLVVVLAWAFDVSAAGIERSAPPSGSHEGGSGARMRGVRLALVLVGIGLLAAAPGLSWYFLGRTRPAANSASPPVAPIIPSIAVLPFADVSPLKDQEYFSDGLSEEILNVLAKIKELHVAGRTSSFSFKGKAEDLRSIGQKLNVATVLEGSVRKSGDQIRITTKLINAADGYHLWSETYDRKLGDVFAVQDEIARAVVVALRVRLLPGQASAARERRPVNPEAYNQYQLAQAFVRRGERDGARLAIEAYEKALALDPQFASAWAGLAGAVAFGEFFRKSPAEFPETTERALAAAEKSIALDPDLAEGYLARGSIRSTFKWDWTGGQADLERAHALNPGHAGILASRANMLASLGRREESIQAARKASELDPLSPGIWFSLGTRYWTNGEVDQARRAFNRALEVSPESELAPWGLGNVSLLEGQPAEALAWYRKCPIENFRLTGVAMAQHDLARPRESQEALDALIALPGTAYEVAQVYGWRGERSRALDWLDRAYALRSPLLSSVKFLRAFRSLHGDRRFSALLRKINLPVE